MQYGAKFCARITRGEHATAVAWLRSHTHGTHSFPGGPETRFWVGMLLRRYAPLALPLVRFEFRMLEVPGPALAAPSRAGPVKAAARCAGPCQAARPRCMGGSASGKGCGIIPLVLGRSPSQRDCLFSCCTRECQGGRRRREPSSAYTSRAKGDGSPRRRRGVSRTCFVRAWNGI